MLDWPDRARSEPQQSSSLQLIMLCLLTLLNIHGTDSKTNACQSLSELQLNLVIQVQLNLYHPIAAPILFIVVLYILYFYYIYAGLILPHFNLYYNVHSTKSYFTHCEYV